MLINVVAKHSSVDKKLLRNMEFVDIVDEQGNVVGQISKDEAHQKNLLHKCVIVEATNSKGEILLIKPYSHKQDAGRYVSPVGGHVKAGESDEDALLREIAEEIGIRKFTHALKGKAIFSRFVLNRYENHFILLYEIITDETPQLGDEAESYTWFTKRKLKQLLKKNKHEFGDAYFWVIKNFYPGLF